eukprot:gene7475-15301_t
MLKIFNFGRKKNEDGGIKKIVESVQQNQDGDIASRPQSVADDNEEYSSEQISEKEMAAVIIQAAARRYIAIQRVRKRSERIWERSFDPRSTRYFWFNKMSGISQWHVPRLLRLHNEIDHAATIQIQKIVRGFIGRMRARKLAHKKYTRYFDGNINKFYWTIKGSSQTFWEASTWLKRQEIPMNMEDDLMYKSHLRILELERKLQEKDEEIKAVRVKRYEELEPEILKDRVQNAKAVARSKDMDIWTVDQLSAWFTEMKMEEHIPFLYHNRVDGELFVNMDDSEYADMGIVNRFQLRKLEIIMRSYKARYDDKNNHRTQGDDDDLMSEYAPSELSDIIEHEGFERDDGDDGQDDDQEYNDGDDDIALTEGEKLERQNEEKNVYVEKLVEGNEEDFPMVGDVVRVRYTCTLADGKMVTSTKAGMQLPAIEFVLGVGQVLKGFDVAIPQMSVGERAKIRMSAEYAYGKEGLFPVVPPHAELVFDMTLLGFRPRVPWVKPLIQQPGLSEKPYAGDEGSDPFLALMAADNSLED